MRILYTIVSLCLLTGCATFSTVQTDENTASDGAQTLVSTRVNARSFFAANSSLSGWKASQSAKTQGASIGSLVVNSDAGTNVAAIAAAITQAAIGAALKP